MITGNPFIRYRTMLDSYRVALTRGWSDADFVALVQRLDDAVAGVEGRGFTVTPLTREPALGAEVGLAGARLWVKDDTGNIAGSHKGRHLFGLMLHEAIDHENHERELVIASCGNAALAAAVVARAAGRRLRVFIPTDAPPSVVSRLTELAATTVECPRVPGQRGDPCYLRFRDAVDAGALAFSCQGTDAPETIDGGRTIAWELAEQLSDAHRGCAHLDRLFVQVGGGALASACVRGMTDAVRMGWLDAPPQRHAVQTQGAAPLERAWRLLRERMGDRGATDAVDEWMAVAAAHADELMWPWEETPHSVAHGIVDDVTYDWLGVVEGMLRSGGSPLVVSEDELLRANDLARRHTSIDADHTGTAGLAGLMHLDATIDAPRPDQTIAVLFTGIRR
ncbi:MAG TPA: pyridoxal-phosphate dependent enzyme [Acidimicrobiales bacterium]|nr:pyridoxal-phosphate dependent enzyme [Acidimicrobiales bacterium]